MATAMPTNQLRLTAWEVAAASGGHVLHVKGEGKVALGVVSDSRAVRPGTAFFALRGETFDGHAFTAKAAQAGAVLLVVEEGSGSPGADVDVVTVKDTLVAWGDVARAHLRAWRRLRATAVPAKTLVITGSAGKTTTKELAATLLAEAGSVWATPGNLNNLVGLPAVAFAIEPEHRFVVLEAGMNVPGEIARLAAIAEPDVALVTNVGVAHTEGVGGSRSHVGWEKGALFAALDVSGTAIACADDAAAMGQLVRTRAAHVCTFGRAEGATYRLLERVSLGVAGSRLTVERPRADKPREAVRVDLPLVGEVAAIDFCGALAAAEAMVGEALDVALVQSGVSRVRPVGGRGETIVLADGTLVIDDSYNANPGSMRAAFRTLAELGAGARRTVAVLGEMKELGIGSEEEHEALGDELAAQHVSVVIGCGGLIDLALTRAKTLGLEVHHAVSAAEAATVAELIARPGDVILVKGSRSVGAEAVVRALELMHGKKEAP